MSRVFLVTDEHAETVTYSIAGGAVREIVAVVTETTGPEAYERSHLTRTRRIEAFVMKDDSEGITTVSRGDTLLWDSVTWCNPEIVSGDAFAQTIRFEHKVSEAASRTRVV